MVIEVVRQYVRVIPLLGEWQGEKEAGLAITGTALTLMEELMISSS